jgi:hypothetical protein
MSNFDCFVGVDWSGNKQTWQEGLQIATASPGSSAPVLEPGPGPKQRWSRKDAAAWLCKLTKERRALIGFDFAFGFPSVREFIGEVTLDWEYVERICARDENYYGGQFFRNDASAHACLVTSPWLKGAQRSARPLRKTEIAAKRTRGAAPQSVFVAIGPAQVGLSSISGMRMLRSVRELHFDDVSIWPFDEIHGRRSAIVEIFPRYFPLSRGESSKLSDHAVLDAALNAFGSAPVSAPPRTEDEGDALLSAAALRCLSLSRCVRLA